MSEQVLCSVIDLADSTSGGYILTQGDNTIGVMAIRQGDKVYTYRNACPHIGTPLDFTPGKFLDKEREYILCSTHGALFRIEDGHCISGPCAGAALTRVESVTRDGIVYVNLGT